MITFPGTFRVLKGSLISGQAASATCLKLIKIWSCIRKHISAPKRFQTLSKALSDSAVVDYFSNRKKKAEES